MYTASVYVIAPPVVTVAGPVFVIERSAEAVTVVTADEVLLLSPVSGSLVLLETVAVFIIAPVAIGAVAIMVRFDVAVAARGVLRVHVTTGPFGRIGEAGIQFQAGLPELVYVTPEGSVSATETLVAELGPLFVTASAYVITPPAATEAGPVFIRERSAEAVTVVNTGPVLLFPVSGSISLPDTLAELLIVPPSEGAVT